MVKIFKVGTRAPGCPPPVSADYATSIIASETSLMVYSMARIFYIIIYISGRPYVVP